MINYYCHVDKSITLFNSVPSKLQNKSENIISIYTKRQAPPMSASIVKKLHCYYTCNEQKLIRLYQLMLVNIMLFAVLKSQSVCTLIHVLIILVFLPPYPTFQLAAIIQRSWMSGLILGILSLQVMMIKLTVLANEIPYVCLLYTSPSPRD